MTKSISKCIRGYGYDGNGRCGEFLDAEPVVDIATAPAASAIRGDNVYSAMQLPSSDTPNDCESHTQRRRKRKRRQKLLPGKTAAKRERIFVQHEYNDLLNDPETIAGNPNLLRLPKESFPMKLHCLLDEVEQDGYAHVITWQPHGRAFIIKDTSLFKQIIMPKYFPTAKKYSSFLRQFNIYGFKRLTRDGPDKGAYYHEAFLRGMPELSSRRMSRKRIKGTGHKACSNPDAEPDFYRDMPFVGESVSGGGSSLMRNGDEDIRSASPIPLLSVSSSSAPTLEFDGMHSCSSATVTSQGTGTTTDTEADSDYLSWSFQGGGSFHQQQMESEAAMEELLSFARQMLQENIDSPSTQTRNTDTDTADKGTRSSTQDFDTELVEFFD